MSSFDFLNGHFQRTLYKPHMLFTWRCLIEGILTVFGDLNGCLSKRRGGEEEGRGGDEEDEERKARGTQFPTARPPAL